MFKLISGTHAEKRICDWRDINLSVYDDSQSSEPWFTASEQRPLQLELTRCFDAYLMHIMVEYLSYTESGVYRRNAEQ